MRLLGRGRKEGDPGEAPRSVEQLKPGEAVYTRQEVVATFNNVFSRFADNIRELRERWEDTSNPNAFKSEERKWIADFYMVRTGLHLATNGRNYLMTEDAGTLPMQVAQDNFQTEGIPVDPLLRFLEREKKSLTYQHEMKTLADNEYEGRSQQIEREEYVLKRVSAGYRDLFASKELGARIDPYGREEIEAWFIDHDPLRGEIAAFPHWQDADNWKKGVTVVYQRRELILPPF